MNLSEKIKSRWLVALTLLLVGCANDFPNYERNAKLAPDEAVLVFRAIDSEFKEGILFDSSPITVTLFNKKTGQYISVGTNGRLDDVESSGIVVKKVKAGTYYIKEFSFIRGNIRHTYFFDNFFFVRAGEVAYAGDIVVSPASATLFIIDNSITVNRKLRHLFPELQGKMKKKIVFDYGELSKLMSLKKQTK